MTTRIATRLLALFAAAMAASAAPVFAEGRVSPAAAFERLKSLAGEWSGQAGDGQAAAQPATVTYRVASGGSVVQETLFPGTPHEMISMYHLADGQLVMTHYCSMANQPRMRLDTASSSAERLVFAFDGGSNFDAAKDGHVHSGLIEVKGEALRADWAFWAGGREAGHKVFDLRRAK